MSRARVALADDDVLLREGLASLLDRSGFDVIGQVGTEWGLLALVRREHPDLVITDRSRRAAEAFDRGTGGCADHPPGTARDRRAGPAARVEVEHAMQLLADGKQVGYLLKSRVTDVEDFGRDIGAPPERRLGGRPSTGQRSSAHAAVMIRLPPSPTVNGRSSRWRQRAARTPASPVASG